jgi:hypothetical protein
MAMSTITFLVVLWTTPFLYLGWRAWVTRPSREERERQREISRLYDLHSEERRGGTGSHRSDGHVARLNG